MTQHQFKKKKPVCAYSCVCVCLCILTPLNTSRLTADLISRKQDLICVMISLRKISERTNWLSPLSLFPSWFSLFFSPFFLRSLSILSMRTVLCKSPDCVSKEKKKSIMSLLTCCLLPWFSWLSINRVSVEEKKKRDYFGLARLSATALEFNANEKKIEFFGCCAAILLMSLAAFLWLVIANANITDQIQLLSLYALRFLF